MFGLKRRGSAGRGRALELAEFGDAQRRVGGKKKFVELRWSGRGAAQHRMDLATMMDLMDEHMWQYAPDGFVLDTDQRATVDLDVALQIFVGERRAEGDEPLVAPRLCIPQVGCARIGQFVVENGEPLAATGQRVEVIAIDQQDVIQGELQRWKEAHPALGERVVGQREARAV